MDDWLWPLVPSRLWDQIRYPKGLKIFRPKISGSELHADLVSNFRNYSGTGDAAVILVRYCWWPQGVSTRELEEFKKEKRMPQVYDHFD